MIHRILTFLLLLPAAAGAQFVRGTIADATTGARINAVNIRLFTRAGRALFGVVSDSSGEFYIPVPTNDSVYVAVERIGYAPVASRAFALGRGQEMNIAVLLVLQAVPLQPVKVLGQKIVNVRVQEFYDRANRNKQMGRGRIWTRADLEKHPPIFLSHLLRMMPVRPAAGCSGNTVFIDRLPVLDSGDPNVDWNDLDLLISPEDTEGIEVYRSPEIPPEFDVSMSLCQVTLIWRKPYGEGGTKLTWTRLFVGLAFIAGVVFEQMLFF